MKPLHLAYLAIPALLISCAGPTVEQRKDAADNLEAHMALFALQQKTYLRMIDDKISDASTIAHALTMKCYAEYDQVTKWYGIINLGNEGQRENFKRMRDSKDEMIRVSLPMVLEYRSSLVNK